MEQVPDYLIDVASISGQGLTQSLIELNEEQIVEALSQLQPRLQSWASDDDFWESATDSFKSDPLAEDSSAFGDALDEEFGVLMNALSGNQPLATTIVTNLPTTDGNATPADARQVVINVNVTINQVVEAHPGPSRKWRALRTLRKVFVIVGGGIAIAADVVSPDVTGITKVASIYGGVAAIVSA